MYLLYLQLFFVTFDDLLYTVATCFIYYHSLMLACVYIGAFYSLA